MINDYPNQTGAGQQRKMASRPRGLNVHRQSVSLNTRRRLLVRGSTPTRKTICYRDDDIRQVASPIIFPRVRSNVVSEVNRPWSGAKPGAISNIPMTARSKYTTKPEDEQGVEFSRPGPILSVAVNPEVM